ncbi:cell division control protein 2 homolog A-like [Rutidosis leptorrhynchoides]|uniref:cell division control protein 2 homolog A-like n=1 Tax=Rutidosis leptorrhynchoides TaxID=125765 RepID=UPI003A9A5D21
MVLEYLDVDLSKYVDSCPKYSVDPRLVKMYLHQILCGVAYFHDHGVVHRDLKLENVLVDRKANVVKVADFGLARGYAASGQRYTPNVGTRCYRAPEVLINADAYTTFDVWSIGCIFAEMVNREPLFKGKSEIDVLLCIFKMMGTPNEDTLPGVTSISFIDSTFPTKDLETAVPDLDEHGLDLLRKMLCVDPHERITAKDALKHEYFNDIRGDCLAGSLELLKF